jgi:hypothetical protein
MPTMETITMGETITIGAMIIMEAEAITMVLRITLMIIMDMATMGMRLITLDTLHAQLEQRARDLFYPLSHLEIQFNQ